jgi:hypothetical protein
MLARISGGLLGSVIGFFAPVFVAALFMPSVSYEAVIPWLCPSVVLLGALGAHAGGRWLQARRRVG